MIHILNRELDTLANELQLEPGMGSQSEPERKQWKCPQCTFLNDEALSVCELCGYDLTQSFRGGKKSKYSHIKTGNIVQLVNGTYARKLNNGQLKFIKKP